MNRREIFDGESKVYMEKLMEVQFTHVDEIIRIKFEGLEKLLASKFEGVGEKFAGAAEAVKSSFLSTQEAIRIQSESARQALSTQTAASEKALAIQTKAVDQHLEELNHAHAKALERDREYVRDGVFQEVKKNMEEWKSSVITELAQTRGRGSGYDKAWTLAWGLFVLIAAPALAALAAHFWK